MIPQAIVGPWSSRGSPVAAWSPLGVFTTLEASDGHKAGSVQAQLEGLASNACTELWVSRLVLLQPQKLAIGAASGFWQGQRREGGSGEGLRKLLLVNVNSCGHQLLKSAGVPQRLCWPLVSSLVKSAGFVYRAGGCAYCCSHCMAATGSPVFLPGS